MKKEYLAAGGIVIIIAIIAIALLLITPQTTGQFPIQKETMTMNVGYNPLAHHAPLFLAIENGYFKEAGIEVNLTKFESPTQMIDAIMQGKIDVTGPGAASGIPAIANYKNPGKIKFYMLSGGTEQYPPARLIVQKDSNITSISELKGKSLGILGSSIQWRTIARKILARNNLEADKDVTLVELAAGVQVTALASKQIDALLALDPMGTVALQTGTGKVLESNPVEKAIDGNSWIGAGVLNLSFEKANPTTAKKYVEIIERATKEIRENPAEAEIVLPKYTPITAEMAPSIVMPQYALCSELDANTTRDLQKYFDIFTKYGIVEGRMNAEAIFYCN